MRSTGANTLVLSPTWTYGKSAPGNNPPVLAPLPGGDAAWFDLVEAASLGQERGLNIAIYPRARTLVASDEWWLGAQRDFSWWPAWFYQYRSFVLHHADLAQRSGAKALILGGEDLAPALPGGVLADGEPSGVPGNAETQWRELLAEVRSRYSGQVVWAVPHGAVQTPPPFLDAVDRVYLTWSVYAPQDLESDIAAFKSWLSNNVLTFQVLLGKPVVLGVSYPSDPSLQVQLDAYNLVIQETAGYDWIAGFVSRGYYPPAMLQDLSASINGKPASSLLEYWYPRLLGEAPR